MKKIFALILAIVMMASMSVVVFAEDAVAPTAAPDDSTVSGGTTLTYGVLQAYLVVIPESQTFVKATGEGATGYVASADVAASGVKVAANEYFKVSVTSANNWKMVDTNTYVKDGVTYRKSQPVSYEATVVGGNNLKTNSEVMSLTSTTENADGSALTATINFTTAGSGQEGNYQDVLTFVVAIVENETYENNQIVPAPEQGE